MKRSLLFSLRSPRFHALSQSNVGLSATKSYLRPQATRSFFTRSAVFCGGRSPIRVNENVDSIEKELADLFQQEIQSPEMDKSGETFQLKKDLLVNHGFELEEHEDRAILKGSKDGRSFSISWSPFIVEQAEDEDEGDYDQQDLEEERDQESDNEDPDMDEEGYSDGDGEEGEYDRSICELEVRVRKGNDAELYLQCGVNPEGQLLVYRLGNNEQSLVVVSELAQEIQYKVYDYLDELGIGDGTADFINEYNEHCATSRHVDTIKYVSEFFSKSS